MISEQPCDLYLVLGVDPAASASQITHAYRALMRRHHPDTRARSPHTAQPEPDQDHDRVLQQVVAAYTVLRDPRLRADYDAHRAQRTRPGHQHGRSEPTPPPQPRTPVHTGPPVTLGTVSEVEQQRNGQWRWLVF